MNNKKMFAVFNLDLKEVEFTGDGLQICHATTPEDFAFNYAAESPAAPLNVQIEFIKGRRFRFCKNGVHSEIWVGRSEKAAEVLELILKEPIDRLETKIWNLHSSIEIKDKEIIALKLADCIRKRQISNFLETSLWQRFKWLFTGVKKI